MEEQGSKWGIKIEVLRIIEIFRDKEIRKRGFCIGEMRDRKLELKWSFIEIEKID